MTRIMICKEQESSKESVLESDNFIRWQKMTCYSYETVAALYNKDNKSVADIHTKLPLHCITGLKMSYWASYETVAALYYRAKREFFSYEFIAALYYRAKWEFLFHMNLSLHCITGLKENFYFI